MVTIVMEPFTFKPRTPGAPKRPPAYTLREIAVLLNVPHKHLLYRMRHDHGPAPCMEGRKFHFRHNTNHYRLAEMRTWWEGLGN